MTRVRWTPNAADDFAAIIERIREDNPGAAQRELVFPPWPFIVVYEVFDTQLNVLRIRHASQDWP